MRACEKVVLFHTGGVVANSRHLCVALPSKRTFHPLSFACIEHPVHGHVLFDTGLGSRSAALVSSGPFRLLARIARAVYADHHQMRLQLESVEIEPETVEHVILSHLHFDHTGGMRDLPNATFHLTRAEWEGAHKLHGIKGLLKGFYLEDFRAANVRFVEFEDSVKVWPFQSGCDLFGDGSIILLPTRGHTVGHQSALVRLESGRQVLLAGDAALVRQNYTIPSDEGLVGRGLRWNHEEAWRTVLKLRAFWKSHPESDVIPTHDARVGRLLKRGPLTIR